LMEWDIEQTSPLVGRKMAELGLPKHALVVSIVRDNDIITPRGATKIKAGDILFVLVRYMDKPAVLHCLDEGVSALNLETD
jgi:cell volume regulation protein A